VIGEEGEPTESLGPTQSEIQVTSCKIEKCEESYIINQRECVKADNTVILRRKRVLGGGGLTESMKNTPRDPLFGRESKVRGG